jgi:transposase
LDIDDILPMYYNRQAVKQIFDYMKNEIDILPLRTHSEETFSGHILISFLATICFISINKVLRKYYLSLFNSLRSLKRFNCCVYNNRLMSEVPIKNVSDVFKTLKIKIPKKIDL